MRKIGCAATWVAAGFVVAAPAAAVAEADHDEQVWLSTTATTDLSAKVSATLELHGRYTDDVSRLGQTLVRPSITLRLPHRLSITGGYVYVRNRFANAAANDEHRTWQQIGYTFLDDRATGVSISGRTRVEQRFRPDADGTGWRLRQQLRLQAPMPGTKTVRAVLWNETFIGLNTTVWDTHRGVDQTRTFIGLGVPLSKAATLEPGYLNQVIYRNGPERINHILAANLFLRL